MIVSSDKDFYQLQRYKNVSQYDPIKTKKLVERTSDPLQELHKHVILGDRGDGIPNILSGDDTFVNGDRQSVINAKRLEFFVEKDLTEYSTEALRNYHRNMHLIDLTKIPKTQKQNIMDAYHNYKGPDGISYEYFFKHGLNNLIDKMNDFRIERVNKLVD